MRSWLHGANLKFVYPPLFFRILLVSECMQKFGAELGEEVWEAVNAIFDVLPLAAIVDNKVKLWSLFDA